MTILTYETLHKIGDIWLEIPKIGKSGIWDFGDAGVHAQTAKIQFWEGVISLSKFFIKSMISDSKRFKIGKSGIWDFGDAGVHAQTAKIQFWEGAISLIIFVHKIGDIWLQMPKIGKSGIWDFGDSEIQFWDCVFCLHNYSTKSVIYDWKLSNLENLEFGISGMLEFTLRRLKSSFGKLSLPLLNSSQNRWYLARNTQNRQIWNLGFRGCWGSRSDGKNPVLGSCHFPY